MVLKDIAEDPSLIIRKAVAAGLMFWGNGDVPVKTFLNALVRIPVLILAIVGSFVSSKLNSRVVWAGIILVAFYWVFHLPFGAPARVSTPILPILYVFASAGILKIWFKCFCRDKKKKS